MSATMLKGARRILAVGGAVVVGSGAAYYISQSTVVAALEREREDLETKVLMIMMLDCRPLKLGVLNSSATAAQSSAAEMRHMQIIAWQTAIQHVQAAFPCPVATVVYAGPMTSAYAVPYQPIQSFTCNHHHRHHHDHHRDTCNFPHSSPQPRSSSPKAKRGALIQTHWKQRR